MGLLLFAKPLVAALFDYRAFTALDVNRTAAALIPNDASLFINIGSLSCRFTEGLEPPTLRQPYQREVEGATGLG